MTYPVTSQNELVYLLPTLFLHGLQIAPASTTLLSVSPGGARDSTNSMTMVVGLANAFGNVLPNTLYANYQQGLFINSAVNGINGLDTGTIAASTQYAVYLIGDSRNYNATGAVISLTSNTAPVLPSGYDSYRLIGFMATDGSSHFVYSTSKPQNMAGALNYFNNPGVAVLTGGTATSFTAMDLTTGSALPTTTLQNIIVTLFVTFTPIAAGDLAQFRPTGSSATTNLPTITGLVAGVAQTQYIQVIAGVGSSKPEIDYKLTSGSDALTCTVVAWTGVSNSAYPALV